MVGITCIISDLKLKLLDIAFYRDCVGSSRNLEKVKYIVEVKHYGSIICGEFWK